MEFLLDLLPIIIYILLIVLLVIGIYVLIRAINIANKIDVLLDNVEEKVNSLNGFFKVLNFTTDKITIVSERLMDGIVSVIKKLFHKRKEEDDYE